ncbi:hypothetical protein [Streptomyces globisporus]|uniref:hypothetical protein n=1 Tax=Streptomyces globisporus TaxID=1908 RepID=UPI0004C9311E|nr:hypothetical protein [Streptomyces globisporus]
MEIEGPRLTPTDAYEKLAQAGQNDHAFEFIQLLRSTIPGVGQRYIFSNNPQQGCDRFAVRDDTGEVIDMYEENPTAER